MSPELSKSIDMLASERASLIGSLASEATGLEWCRRHTEILDEAVRRLFEAAQERAPARPPVAVVATGGYGRRELAPYSDVDLAVLPMDEADPGVDDLVRVLYQYLHRAIHGVMGLEVGYAFRLIHDAPVLDGTGRTGMLDARLVAGDSAPLDAFLKEFRATFPAGEFVIEKLAERESMFQTHHDTPFVAEPHVKEGAGGLRSWHCANWLLGIASEKVLPAGEDVEQVARARNLLHYVSQKKNDRLSRQRQAEIADLTGRSPDSVVSEVIGAMARIHDETLCAIEKVKAASFRLSAGVAARDGRVHLEAGLAASDAARGIAIATRLGLKPPAGPLRVNPVVDGPEALYVVSTGEATLRNLFRSGLLDVMLPELTRCQTLVPSDPSHAYSVFEHTLRVVRNLDRIAPGSYWGEVLMGLPGRGPLVFAALLHDVGKFEDEADHCAVGERVAREVCARWGLSTGVSDLVCWLVGEHLAMDRTTRVRDIANPETIREFASLVGTEERLDHLALLTLADIDAVSDEALTSAQELAIRELRERTLEALRAGRPMADPAVLMGRIRRMLPKEASQTEVEAFLDSLPAHYVVATPPEVVATHMALVANAKQGKPSIDLRHDVARGLTEVTACCLDAPGLLSRLLGVLYAWDVSVEGIRVSTTKTEPPVALDVFTVSFGGRPLPPATASHVLDDLRAAATGELAVADLLRSRGKDPERAQTHFSHVYVPGDPGILEIQAPRGRGLAFRFSRWIAEQGWNISAARFSQWGGRAAAAFYVSGPGQRPLSAEEVAAALQPKV